MREDPEVIEVEQFIKRMYQQRWYHRVWNVTVDLVVLLFGPEDMVKRKVR